MTEKQVNQAVSHFLSCFEELRYIDPEDRFEAEGRQAMADTVRGFVEAGQPISILLPGFAHKNPNSETTLGPLPDLAELVVLRRLHRFCAAVTTGYCPPGARSGCELTIFADGRVWGGLAGVGPEDYHRYNSGIKAMVADSPHILWGSMEDYRPHLKGDSSHPIMDLIALHWETPEALDALNESLFGAGEMTPDRSDLLRVYTRFLGFVKKNHIDHISADDGPMPEAEFRMRSIRMMRRFAAFNEALEAVYPSHLRFSVHERVNCGPKFAVRLFAESESCELPYHRVVVVEPDGRNVPMLCADAKLLPGARLVHTDDGQPWCFRRDGSDFSDAVV